MDERKVETVIGCEVTKPGSVVEGEVGVADLDKSEEVDADNKIALRITTNGESLGAVVDRDQIEEAIR